MRDGLGGTGGTSHRGTVIATGIATATGTGIGASGGSIHPANATATEARTEADGTGAGAETVSLISAVFGRETLSEAGTKPGPETQAGTVSSTLAVLGIELRTVAAAAVTKAAIAVGVSAGTTATGPATRSGIGNATGNGTETVTGTVTGTGKRVATGVRYEMRISLSCFTAPPSKDINMYRMSVNS